MHTCRVASFCLFTARTTSRESIQIMGSRAGCIHAVVLLVVMLFPLCLLNNFATTRSLLSRGSHTADDFAAIPRGVAEGRLIFANLRRVVAYQTSAGSWSEALPVLACFFVGMPQPLSSFLMIVICCITDVAAGIALMYEKPEGNLMTDKPRDVQRVRLVTLPLMLYSYLFIGNMQSLRWVGVRVW